MPTSWRPSRKGKFFGEHIKPLAFDKFPAPVEA